MHSESGIEGHLAAYKTATGEIAFEKHNMVLDKGIAGIMKLVVGGSVNITHMGVGADDTAAAPSDEGLADEVARVAVTSKVSTTTDITDDSVQIIAEFGPGVATGALKEAALFTSDSGDTAWTRNTFGVYNKEVDDGLTLVWTLRLKRANP